LKWPRIFKNKSLKLPKIVELLGSKDWDEMQEKEPPRSTIYLNKGRYDERFAHYFFDGATKIVISRDELGRADAEVNALLLKIGGQFGIDNGKTIEIDIGSIPHNKKALYVEYYARSRGKLLDPINSDIQKKEVLYKCDGKSFFADKHNMEKIYNLVGENKGKEIYDEYHRQERYNEDGGKESDLLWILPSKHRTLAAVLSTKHLPNSDLTRYNDQIELGFTGSFEKSVQLSNPDHLVLFLTPWWLWHY
jgi:hypothetical protein